MKYELSSTARVSDKFVNTEDGEKMGTFLKVHGESISNITYEAPETFQNSVSYDAYKRAFHITEEIISANRGFWDSKGKPGNGTNMRNGEQISNILFFTGDRGAGKTSVMLSYMEFLKDYYRNLTGNEPDKKLGELRFLENKENIYLMFTGLEYIDASLLGKKGEDILSSVLPKMLKKWMDEEKRSRRNEGIVQDADYNYKKRQMQMQFNNVYKRLKDLRSKEDILDSDSDMFMETLQNLSLTWNLKQSFQELVKTYLDIMQYPGSERMIGERNHFLVISIDDLDMNISHGFQLLEQIRSYLMVPNVIILLSANYEQLEKICYNHYSVEFRKIRREAGNQEYISRLSREYLEKIMPAHCQIPLETGLRWKFYRETSLEHFEYIYRNETQVKYDNVTLQSINAKEIYKALGVSMMPQGNCLMYWTPETLREFALLMKQLNALEFLKEPENPEDKRVCLEVYERNSKWFWKEKFPSMCKKFLNYEEQELFERLGLLEPVGQIETVKQVLKARYEHCKSDSLLELLGAAESGTLSELSFAVMSMIYFSVRLSELIFRAKCSENRNERKRIYEKLCQYYDGGLWGKWEKYMGSRVIELDEKETAYYNIFRDDELFIHDQMTFKLKETVTSHKWENVKRLIGNNVKEIRTFQYLLLFYDLPYDYGFETISIKENTVRLEKRYKGTYSLSNAVLGLWKTSWEGEELSYEFPRKLLYKLCPGIDFTRNDVEELMEKISIIPKLRIWGNEKALLPLNDIEFLVHTGKRIQEQLGKEKLVIQKELLDDAIKRKILEYFDIIKGCLSEYDQGYGEHFSKCPLYTEIKENNSVLLEMLKERIKRQAHTYDGEEKDW